MASDICDLCTLEETTRPGSDPCLKAIAQNLEPWDICPYEKVRNPQDTVVKLNERQWAYSDDTPGHLTEECDGMNQVYELPTTGILNLNNSCEYQIINNPISMEELRADRITIQDVSDYPYTNSTDMDDLSVEKHLKNNFLVYIITLGSLLLLLIVTWALSCYCRMKTLRIRIPTTHQRRRRPRQSTLDPATTIPLISAALALPRQPRPNPIIL
jgi:hypothetical protein